MIRLSWICAAWLAAVLPAQAATYVCEAQAKGAAGQVIVMFKVQDGRLASGVSRWLPAPDAGSSQHAQVILERDYLDAQTTGLGPYNVLASVNYAQLAPPVADNAVVGVATAEAMPIFKDWTRFDAAVARLKAGQPDPNLPAGTQPPAGMVGIVPVSRRDAGGAALLDSLADAKSVTTTVTDKTGGGAISKGVFPLTDRAGADALAAQADAAARLLAKTPETSCKTS